MTTLHILDLWRSHPLFRRGARLGLAAGVLLGIALAGVAVLVSHV